MSRVSQRLPRSLTTLALAVAVFATVARASQGETPPGQRVVVRGPVAFAMKQQVLFDELNERRREEREVAKRARHGHATAGPGAKARRVDLPDGVASAPRPRPTRTLNAQAVLTNAQANDKSGDAVGVGQSEESLAFFGLNGLCAWNNGEAFVTPIDGQGIAWSVDGGATWIDGGAPIHGGTISLWRSDPSVSVNEKTGEFYYCGLTQNGSGSNGVGVMRGHFAGGTFVQDAAMVVASGLSTNMSFDKQWIAADSLTGNLYVSWTLFTASSNAIFFSRSTDDGATWSAPLQMSLPAEAGRVQGSRPAVGPNGEVYVTFSSLGTVDVDFMMVRKSTDFGATFGPEVVAASEYSNFASGAPGFNRSRGITFPSIAIDRSTGTNRGRVYVAYNEAVNFYGDSLGGPSQSEVENDGNFANATPFTPGETLRGSQMSMRDLDYWRFDATQGTTYVFFVDSLRSSIAYVLRLYCPNDTTAQSQLSNAGSQTAGGHVVLVWTAPATQANYLLWQPTLSGGGYRIQTGVHTPSPTDHARDQRDAMVVSSTDGVTWSAPARMNDDPPWLDDWLPEVAAACDGNVYGMWFDWRDTPESCFGGSNIYVSRSSDAGVTWAPNQVATTVPTPNWTQVLSNIAPNQGDYLGMYGGDAVGLAFADGRLGDPDVFAARIECQPVVHGLGDTTVNAGATYAPALDVRNPNAMFANDAILSVTADREWPGVPFAGGAGTVPASSDIAMPFSLEIPDTAAAGDVHLCFTVAWAGGACPQTFCQTLEVAAPLAVQTSGEARLSLRGVFPNPSSGRSTLWFSLASSAPARLEILDLGGRRVFEREVGSMGAGFHVLPIDQERSLPIGVYVVRLSQGGRVVTNKATVIR